MLLRSRRGPSSSPDARTVQVENQRKSEIRTGFSCQSALSVKGYGSHADWQLDTIFGLFV